jgi:glycerol-3-phosphate O-acyltransferase
MATQEGVTRAVFLEGGLSLDYRLAAPRLGLINYVISVWAADGAMWSLFLYRLIMIVC